MKQVDFDHLDIRITGGTNGGYRVQLSGDGSAVTTEEIRNTFRPLFGERVDDDITRGDVDNAIGAQGSFSFGIPCELRDQG